jgi:protein-S-isoprenylcysteine O-methyltransferase Ste14
LSLLPTQLLGHELDLLPPLVLGGLVLVRRVAERLLTWHREEGKRSGLLSTALLFLSYVSALAFALWALGRGDTPVPVAAAAGALWAGAVAFRMWALAHLKEQFSFWIEIREGQRLVDTGPYAIIRHPLHLAFALEVTAFALAAWSAWAVSPAALAWIVVLVRNRTEERALRAHFGGAWDDYAARVPSMDFLRGLVNRGGRRPVP